MWERIGEAFVDLDEIVYISTIEETYSFGGADGKYFSFSLMFKSGEDVQYSNKDYNTTRVTHADIIAKIAKRKLLK